VHLVVFYSTMFAYFSHLFISELIADGISGISGNVSFELGLMSHDISQSDNHYNSSFFQVRVYVGYLSLSFAGLGWGGVLIFFLGVFKYDALMT